MHRAAGLLLFALCLPAAAGDRTIPVLSTASGEQAATPQAALWRRVPVVNVPLQPAFPGHPYISGTPATQAMTVQAARIGGRLYLRLAWADATANDRVDGTHRFADGAAVQFPLNGRDSTTPFMGDGEQAVNVWHWRADGRVENLLARGFGTSARIAAGGLKAAAARTADGWAVVLARPLQARPGEGASLAGRNGMPIAFAAWDGDNQERDGLKAVTLEWWQLRF